MNVHQLWNRIQRDKVPPRSPARDYRDARIARAEGRAKAQENLARGRLYALPDLEARGTVIQPPKGSQ